MTFDELPKELKEKIYKESVKMFVELGETDPEYHAKKYVNSKEDFDLDEEIKLNED